MIWTSVTVEVVRQRKLVNKFTFSTKFLNQHFWYLCFV